MASQTQIVFQTACFLNQSMLPTPCLFIQFDHVFISHYHKTYIMILLLIFIFHNELFSFCFSPFSVWWGKSSYLKMKPWLNPQTYVFDIFFENFDLAMNFSPSHCRFSYFLSDTYFNMEILPLIIEAVLLALLWYFYT